MNELILLLPLVVLLLAAGLITGVLAGLFGVGGGAILVPVLDAVFAQLGVPAEIRMHMAVGTSLAIIIPTSWRSFTNHRAKDAVLMPVLKTWTVPVVLGVVTGTVLAASSSSVTLRAVFAGMALFNGLKLLFGRDAWRIADHLPSTALMRAYGYLIGLLSAMMGIGGGVFGSMALTLYNIPIHKAVATASGLGVLISIPAALGYLLTGLPTQSLHPEVFPAGAFGYVHILAVLIIAPMSTLTASLGVRMAHRLSRTHLSKAFGVFLLLIAARFLASLFA